MLYLVLRKALGDFFLIILLNFIFRKLHFAIIPALFLINPLHRKRICLNYCIFGSFSCWFLVKFIVLIIRSIFFFLYIYIFKIKLSFFLNVHLQLLFIVIIFNLLILIPFILKHFHAFSFCNFQLPIQFFLV
jgi:hypothetical protein